MQTQLVVELRRKPPARAGWSGRTSHPRARGELLRALALAATLLLGTGRGAAVRAEGVSLGVHAGYASLDGEIFEGAEELEGTRFAGIHLYLPIAKNLRLALSGEGRSEELTFDRAGAEEALSGQAKWTDQTLRASLHLRLVPIGSGPTGIYVGGGGGMQIQEIEIHVETHPKRASAPGRAAGALRSAVARRVAGSGVLSGEPSDPFIDEIEKETTNVSYHALAGISLPLSPAPLSIFAEIRFEEINGDWTPRSTSAYGGLTLDL